MSPNPDDFTFLLGSTVHRPGRVTPSGSSGPTAMKSPLATSNDLHHHHHHHHHHQVVRSSSDSGKSSGGPLGSVTPVSRGAEASNAAGNAGGGKPSAIRKKSAPVNSNPININSPGYDFGSTLLIDLVVMIYFKSQGGI